MGSRLYNANSSYVISLYEFRHIVAFLTFDADLNNAKTLDEMRNIDEAVKISGKTEYWILAQESAWCYFNHNEKYTVGLKNFKVENMTNLLHRAEEHFIKSFYNFKF